MNQFINADTLIDALVQSTIATTRDPKNRRLLKAAGMKRKQLESYLFNIERRLGVRDKNGVYKD